VKDALGHGSNNKGGYNAVTASVVPAHGTGVARISPSLEQFQKYRADRRDTVHELNQFYKGKPNDWAKGVIRTARQEHSASIVRQGSLK
jgi:hypothetical protein